MKQLSQEWFTARIGRVTGSRVGAILGFSPFSKGSGDVMRDMIRATCGAPSEFMGNIATEYGNRNEAEALEFFKLETGFAVEEVGLVVHPLHAWLAASPDGLIGDDAVLEIKCPFGQRNKNPPEFKSIFDNDLRHYYAQIQIEMFCTERTVCFFYQWAPAGQQLEIVDADPQWIADYFDDLQSFYDDYLEELKDPEMYLDPVGPPPKLQNLTLSDRYRAAKVDFEQAKHELEIAKEALVEFAHGEKIECDGLKIYPTERQGSIAYAKVVKDLLPDADLEPYRGEPSISWTVK
jgi:putative phage-type endonuclease